MRVSPLSNRSTTLMFFVLVGTYLSIRTHQNGLFVYVVLVSVIILIEELLVIVV